MVDTRTVVAKAAAAAGLDPARVQPVAPTRWEGLLDDILDRFTVRGRANRGRTWWWDDLREPVERRVVESPADTLVVLAALLPPRAPAWLLVEDAAGTKERSRHWLFATDAGAVPHLLAEMPSSELVVVDAHLAWAVGETHHGGVWWVGQVVGQTAR